MIQHVWTVICGQSSVDSKSNNLSLFNVLEEITAEPHPGTPVAGIPLLMLPFEIVTLWRRFPLEEPAKGSARILLHAPQTDPEQLGGTHDLDLTEYRRLRTVISVNSIKLSVSGTYQFILESTSDGQWTEVARVPLEITLVTPKSDSTP